MKFKILEKRSCKRRKNDALSKESKVDETQFVKKTRITKIEIKENE